MRFHMGQMVKMGPKGLMVCGGTDPDRMGSVVASDLKAVVLEMVTGEVVAIDDSVPEGTVKIWGEGPCV